MSIPCSDNNVTSILRLLTSGISLSEGVYCQSSIMRYTFSYAEGHILHHTISNAQNETIVQGLRSSVIKSFPYSSAFVSYSVGKRGKIRRRKRQNAENAMDVFYILMHFRVDKHVSLPFYSAHFLPTVIFARFSVYRTLVLVSHFITVSKQPPPSLHIQHCHGV